MAKRLSLELSGDFTNNVSIGKFDIVHIKTNFPTITTNAFVLQSLTGRVTDIVIRSVDEDKIDGYITLTCDSLYRASNYSIDLEYVENITLLDKYVPAESEVQIAE